MTQHPTRNTPSRFALVVRLSHNIYETLFADLTVSCYISSVSCSLFQSSLSVIHLIHMREIRKNAPSVCDFSKWELPPLPKFLTMSWDTMSMGKTVESHILNNLQNILIDNCLLKSYYQINHKTELIRDKIWPCKCTTYVW